ncbi:hypothetical protein F0562_019866 [Nyssa sinensis]|uniref:RING-type E3 ubiquitin transferase n=1 Tax=Nyssa sinensis TaxID=561372 RepID=A0A5J5BTM3_9ASTE|nr:hypothetical protein F0562_019866 [Nyssa sinensis]
MGSVEKKNISRPIAGLLSCNCTAQHAIVSLSVLILLSPAIPAVGAQPPPNGTGPANPYQRFSPSMAIIIAILVAALFLMGFFSIYIRRCSENSDGSISRLGALGASLRSRRAASRGLDPAVIENFPTFVYSVVKGLKIGKGALECAVCLNEFEDDETLRLIPKCDHVFHPECIDAWLESHVTCPVCRANLVPEPGETVQVPDLNAVPDQTTETDNQQNDDVSIRITDDLVVPVLEPPQVVDRNSSLHQNRPPRSRSVRALLFGKFPRSHSTGHSLVQPGENMDRFTLRLPEDLRKQVMNRTLNRTTSCLVPVLPRETSSRRGYRTGGGEGSSRGRNFRRFERLDGGAKSDRWVFSKAPPFFSRAPSVRSPRVAAGPSSTTPKGSVKAVKTPFNCPEQKGDETGIEQAEHQSLFYLLFSGNSVILSIPATPLTQISSSNTASSLIPGRLYISAASQIPPPEESPPLPASSFFIGFPLVLTVWDVKIRGFNGWGEESRTNSGVYTLSDKAN